MVSCCLFSCREDDSSVPPIAMVLKEHFDSTITHDLDDVNRVTVRRKHIWRDAIRALSRPTFDPCRRVQVTFVGEEAVDGGGPSREFFALALQELAEDGSIFQGSQHNRFFCTMCKHLPAGNISMLVYLLQFPCEWWTRAPMSCGGCVHISMLRSSLHVHP